MAENVHSLLGLVWQDEQERLGLSPALLPYVPPGQRHLISGFGESLRSVEQANSGGVAVKGGLDI